jgi:hypothetical protein
MQLARLVSVLVAITRLAKSKAVTFSGLEKRVRNGEAKTLYSPLRYLRSAQLFRLVRPNIPGVLALVQNPKLLGRQQAPVLRKNGSGKTTIAPLGI